MQVLCEAVQQATGSTVKLAWADLGYTGEQAKQAAWDNGIDLQVVKLPEFFSLRHVLLCVYS